MTTEDAVTTLRAGGVVGLPTDTVYGLAALPTVPSAVERLYEIKGRPTDKPIALLVPSVDAASMLVELEGEAERLARAHWPGALTLVLAAAVPLAEWVGDRGLTVGVRMPASETALRLLTTTGPLAVTSANLSGLPPALDHVEARAMFGDLVDGYVEGQCPGGSASTVVDATGDSLVVIRPGPVEV